MTLLHDQYKIIKRLGTGGMSQVFLCIDNHIGKKWAIKQIPYRNDNLRLIESEIKTLKELDYYLFPRITDAWNDKEYYYIVTDYIEGKTLEDIMPVPENTVLKYVRDLVNALRFLHCQSPPIIYLDMKPSNIMVKPDGSIMLIDFGIAQSVIEPSKTLGTRGYAAPEQYLSGLTLSEKTDVFALGMTIYALLTGEQPHKSLPHQIQRIKSNKKISYRMKNLILNCTLFQQKDRYDLVSINAFINKTVAKDKGVKIVMFVSVLAAMIMCTIIGTVSNERITRKQIKASEDMVNLISECVEDGEYTKDGIRIICGYLDGNFLDEETDEYYTYVVARNLFEVQGDYLNSKRYFDRLDREKYPESIYFSEICDVMTGFEFDSEKVSLCLSGFQKYNEGLIDETQKEKNRKVIKMVQLTERLKNK